MTEQSARTQFLRTIKQMEGAAILLRDKNDGRFATYAMYGRVRNKLS